MRWISSFCAVWLLLVAPGPASAGVSRAGKVIDVSDGDTITVLLDKTPVKIRLHGVDCPEKAQAFGQEARQLTSRLVLGKMVRVEVVTRDRQGHAAARVYITTIEGIDHYDDGTHAPVDVTRCLNVELVKAGLAWWNREHASGDKQLARLEAEAKKARRGLWADANPVPPWQWRRANHKPRCSSDDDCMLRLCCCSWRALVKGAPAPPTCARRCRCKFPPKPKGVRCDSGKCKVIYREQAAVPSNIEAVRRSAPPRLPWSKGRACKKDRDCVFAHSPCPRCPPCKPTWRAVTNRAAYRRREAFFARRRIRCPRCKPCPEGSSKWLGSRAVCHDGQCAVSGSSRGGQGQGAAPHQTPPVSR